MKKPSFRILLSTVFLLLSVSIGFCDFDGVDTFGGVPYAEFTGNETDFYTEGEGQACVYRVGPFPESYNLAGKVVSGRLQLGTNNAFTGMLVTEGGSTYNFTLANNGYFKAPVKLMVRNDNYAEIYIYNNDINYTQPLCSMFKPSNVIYTKLVAEK